ncbi:catechol 2,3-dioxygenase-like lactoylglutathione lyase family enzyme [Enterococcus sp. PF1-24]|uniref:FosX/FosE/FosI family fosfomycin resistance hydrolase n=1 Tax=unclassified Enterococcus TaxID=2608891 RepID=UPI00247503EA|nr:MULTISPECIES: FosX/FosE/FosI family fosfomycin resistance hydrolase [unclassified Enterococcus]MDH6364584.1 catechol 2,3-dioxygenase-like lactoylglutathione lyase family enzyme [Enterococcus sp. PFB1-1]MDH6401685.1 catechol 2,3-dioxygenase-like lactoylglutathione lyase family enzyme [Enterococcus sp. PF1-24]
MSNNLQGISHITLIVKDIEKTALLFKNLFNGKEIYDSKVKNFSYSREKFFLINNIWFAIMEGSVDLPKNYNHIAFKIDEQYYENYLSKIQDLNLEIRKTRSRISGESKSIYFYDYDNHLFELHTGTLEERLKEYHRI